MGRGRGRSLNKRTFRINIMWKKNSSPNGKMASKEIAVQRACRHFEICDVKSVSDRIPIIYGIQTKELYAIISFKYVRMKQSEGSQGSKHTTTVAKGGWEKPTPSRSAIWLFIPFWSTKHRTKTAIPTPHSTISCDTHEKSNEKQIIWIERLEALCKETRLSKTLPKQGLQP